MFAGSLSASSNWNAYVGSITPPAWPTAGERARTIASSKWTRPRVCRLAWRGVNKPLPVLLRTLRRGQFSQAAADLDPDRSNRKRQEMG